eukprot:1155928-Pelagomonas_calceolata.AAC.6
MHPKSVVQLHGRGPPAPRQPRLGKGGGVIPDPDQAPPPDHPPLIPTLIPTSDPGAVRHAGSPPPDPGG